MRWIAFVSLLTSSALAFEIPPKSCGVLKKPAGTFPAGTALRILTFAGSNAIVEPVADATGCTGEALAAGWSHEKNVKKLYRKSKDHPLDQATIDGPANLRDRPSGKNVVGSFANNANAYVQKREGKWLYLSATPDDTVPADGVAKAPQQTISTNAFEPLFRVMESNRSDTVALCGSEFPEPPIWFAFEQNGKLFLAFLCSEGLDGMPTIHGVIRSKGDIRRKQVLPKASTHITTFQESMAVFQALAKGE